ncbi:type I-D CRISPR-associated endonuclease Cas1d [Spirulina sp. CS-785/01]|uniref:type I-D CRISPR-associated endonuclease Cas1d n=1 Tax=Spirulina sp. CS-785/01 TaxID=3021716 RepID=UPI00232B8648|nr:type I-D CRISPR-associated endonuclease Cas1d [Spirulina sp. CS-785/01]MDB9316015.1 type I-D CRISPR-associated endonuclease Cas1d [Spirulina sp. CS-785/01]
MGTIYVTREDSFIGKTDERLTVKAEKKMILDVPLIKVEGVVALGRTTVSPAVVTELLQRHIPLSFLKVTGRYLGRLEPEMTKNIFVRKAQWGAVGEDQAVDVVRGLVRGKLKNYRNGLMRRLRQSPDLPLQESITKIEQAIKPIARTEQVDSLRGLEGAGSAAYFGCFGQLIQNEGFSFCSRRRRPPTDPVNSLLSLGYALLRHDIQSAVNIVGFDPYLGYLHVTHYGRPALALDLMEEFRPLVVDAVVLAALNQNKLTLEDFTTEPLSGAVSLTPEGLKVFLRLYEQKKQSKFKHPVLKRQCTYQEAFEIQARLLAKFLLGETEEYPPLVVR